MKNKEASLAVSPEVLATLVGFADEYLDSNLAAGFSAEQCGQSLQIMMKEVARATSAPHKFSPYHQAIREPFDYYSWANNFFRPLIKLERSQFFGADEARRIAQLVADGHNVVILSNHQTEADPQVTTDPVAIPYSMGRNLICIHSKKHIKSPPEDAPRKQQENLASMQALGELFAQGGHCFWVAPSGGRDRPAPADPARPDDAEQFVVAPYDSKVLDMFRLLAMQTNSADKTHFFPMAMFTHQLVPPPKTVSSGVGEARSAQRGEVSVHLLSEMDGLGSVADRDYCRRLQSRVEEAYTGLHQWHYSSQ
eukprot:gene6112-4389_t